MKVICYCTLFVLGVLPCKLNTQTYISPVIGYDFQRVISQSDHAFKISHSGFSYNSLLIGIKLRYKIYKPINFGISCEYTKKRVHGYYYGGVFNDFLFSYNYFRNVLSLQYVFKDFIFLSAGFLLNIVNDFSIKDLERPKVIYNNLENINEYAYSLSVGAIFGKFNFELYYLHRQYKELKRTYLYYSLMDGIDNVGIRLGYEIKLFNGFGKKKGTECPDFKS